MATKIDPRDAPDIRIRDPLPAPAPSPEESGTAVGQPAPSDGGFPVLSSGGAPPIPPPGTPPPPPAPRDPGGDLGAGTLPIDLIGDIPPPPVPLPPIGLAGGRGAEGSTFARPGSPGARPFRTLAFSQRPQRFGPGVPVLGSTSTDVGEPSGLGISPEEAAELLRALAAGGAGR